MYCQKDLQPIYSPQDLGLAIWRTRRAMRLTQAEVALAAGVGLRFVVELEAGKSTVRLDKVLQVLQALGASLQLAGVPLADDQPQTQPNDE